MGWEFDVMMPNKVGRITKLLNSLGSRQVNVEAILAISRPHELYRRVRFLADDLDRAEEVLTTLNRDPDYLRDWRRTFVPEINLPPSDHSVLEHVVCSVLERYSGPLHALYMEPLNHELSTVAVGVDGSISKVEQICNTHGLGYALHTEFAITIPSTTAQLCAVLGIFNQHHIYVDSVAAVVYEYSACPECGEHQWLDVTLCRNCQHPLPERSIYPLTLRLTTHTQYDSVAALDEIVYVINKSLRHEMHVDCAVDFTAAVQLPHRPGAIVDFISLLSADGLNAHSLYVFPDRGTGVDLVVASPFDPVDPEN